MTFITPDLSGTLNDVKASRAVSTNYQNTGLSIMIVMICLQSDSNNCAFRIKVENANPATIERFQYDEAAANAMCYITALIPPGYYYNVTNSLGTVTIDHWIEFTL